MFSQPNHPPIIQFLNKTKSLSEQFELEVTSIADMRFKEKSGTYKASRRVIEYVR